jgi:hypothetical protein
MGGRGAARGARPRPEAPVAARRRAARSAPVGWRHARPAGRCPGLAGAGAPCRCWFWRAWRGAVRWAACPGRGLGWGEEVTAGGGTDRECIDRGARADPRAGGARGGGPEIWRAVARGGAGGGRGRARRATWPQSRAPTPRSSPRHRLGPGVLCRAVKALISPPRPPPQQPPSLAPLPPGWACYTAATAARARATPNGGCRAGHGASNAAPRPARARPRGRRRRRRRRRRAPSGCGRSWGPGWCP